MSETTYDSQGHPYTPLEPATSLRYARAAEDRYSGSDLPTPDLNPGTCSECHRDAHTRWQHGQEELCRQCRRRRDRALLERPEQRWNATPLPHFSGECQRCPTIGLLAIVAKRFLCALHAKHARRAQRAARARADRMKGSDE